MIYTAIVYPPAQWKAITTIANSHQRLNFHRQHRRQITHNRRPTVSRIGGGVYLASSGPEINPAFIQRIDSHGIAQHIHVAVFLRQSFGERLPLVATGAAAEDTQLALQRKMFRIALDWDDVN